MWPECGHKSGLWDDSIFQKESYAENLKKIVGAVLKLAFFSKNRITPQTTFVPTFWLHIISELDGEFCLIFIILSVSGKIHRKNFQYCSTVRKTEKGLLFDHNELRMVFARTTDTQ